MQRPLKFVFGQIHSSKLKLNMILIFLTFLLLFLRQNNKFYFYFSQLVCRCYLPFLSILKLSNLYLIIETLNGKPQKFSFDSFRDIGVHRNDFLKFVSGLVCHLTRAYHF